VQDDTPIKMPPTLDHADSRNDFFDWHIDELSIDAFGDVCSVEPEFVFDGGVDGAGEDAGPLGVC
jgi:hypothetical protein